MTDETNIRVLHTGSDQTTIKETLAISDEEIANIKAICVVILNKDGTEGIRWSTMTPMEMLYICDMTYEEFQRMKYDYAT